MLTAGSNCLWADKNPDSFCSATAHLVSLPTLRHKPIFLPIFISVIMKNLFSAAVALALVAGFAASCSKEQSNTEKLTGTWRVEETDYDFGADGSIDSTSTPDACEADDDLIVAANGTYTTNYNTLCDPTDPQTDSGTWAFSGDETILTITSNAFPLPIPFAIEELTSDHLKLSISDGTDKTITHYHKQ